MDLWLAWLIKENDSTWTWERVTWDLTWLYLHGSAGLDFITTLIIIINHCDIIWLKKTQATEPAAVVIWVCAVHDIARAQEHSVPNTGSKRISLDVWINTSNLYAFAKPGHHHVIKEWYVSISLVENSIGLKIQLRSVIKLEWLLMINLVILINDVKL